MIRKHCYLIPQPKEPLCLVHLGRFGDLMIILPACLHIYQTTGIKPVIAVASEFASILDGVSYVEPWVMTGANWVTDSRAVYEKACQYYSDVRVPKWWDCHGMEPPAPMPNEQFIELTHLGRKIFIRPEEWESYMYSQWKSCGWTRQNMLDWPLVFDRRSPQREEELSRYALGPRRPVILYNMSGRTSPVVQAAEALKHIWPLRMRRAHIVDLSSVTAHRIYDLLGLYDRSIALVTGDTATLHLAAAHNIPTIALLNNGGAGSIVRCNCILKLRYEEIVDEGWRIRDVLENLFERKNIGHQLHHHGV